MLFSCPIFKIKKV